MGCRPSAPRRRELRQAGQVTGKAAVAEWEAFLNDPDPRNQLVAPYIFDHVYQASIVLEESPGDFFRLVRSAAPASQTLVQTLEDWTALRNRYGILRNSERFWPSLDWFNDWNFRRRREEAGYLDLSYYDLLDTVY